MARPKRGRRPVEGRGAHGPPPTAVAAGVRRRFASHQVRPCPHHRDGGSRHEAVRPTRCLPTSAQRTAERSEPEDHEADEEHGAGDAELWRRFTELRVSKVGIVREQRVSEDAERCDG
jgi:hypothetical protein